jgi:hypothetical protein
MPEEDEGLDDCNRGRAIEMEQSRPTYSPALAFLTNSGR